ncbi:MAG: hypothetical protein KAT90_06400, partial [Gammaproteobacteria bacterium]|nr:hypothetical protein [Gammaproteobacteria bacterium]
WTVPLISKKILKLIKATTGVVLLVSQQVNSNVRQTLFRDGKLISSRQSIINQDISDISGMGKLAAPEVDRTIDFLRTQNLINEKEVISLHVLGSEEQMPSLQQYFKSSDSRTVNIHLISELQQKLGLSGVSNKFSAELFSWLCISQGIAFSHYGDRQLFNRYFNKLAATSLYVASLLVLITGVLLTEENISDAMEYEKSITLLKIEEKSYKDLYSKKFKDFEEVFENAGVMNSAVELAERIKINSTTSPLDFLLAISDILSQGDEQVLHIDRIEWQAVNINEKNNKINDASFVGKLAVKHNAIIFGRIDVPDNDYRESINHIRKIVKYLEASPRIENVETLKMPVD